MLDAKFKSTIRIYVDLDGVLADFDKHFENIYGVHPRTYEDTHGTKNFWDTIFKTEEYFFNIPPFSHHKEMWDFVVTHFDHVSILSSPSSSNTELTKDQKRRWCNKHLCMPCGSHVPAIFRSDKHVYADARSILIDDYPKKIKAWKNAGGIAIHHTSWDETKKQLLSILEPKE